MISLAKGQTISLDKPGGLTRVRMGLGWDPVKSGGGLMSRMFGGGGGDGGSIDLDASCVMFSRGSVVDSIWFGQLRSKDGSIVHSGDNRTGDGDGDDESIMVDLTRLPPEVDALAFTVNSFTGQNFDAVDNCHCRLVDSAKGDEELCSFRLAERGSHTGVVMVIMKRGSSGWSVQAIGETGSGRSVESLIPQIKRHL